jgi:wobble nucleotide-excising tRNase
MLKGVQLLRNIGKFDSAQTPVQPAFDRLTLLYAENGRGKTTLAAVLRSLADNDPGIIASRRRLTAAHAPHVIIPLTAGGIVQFQNGQWTGTAPVIAVFDDEFVAQNVCSGIEITSDHRQKLHELIIGAQGVALSAALQTHVDAIEVHNRQIKAKGDAIPAVERQGLAIDAFCALQADANIDAAILSGEQAVAAAKSADAVKARAGLTAPTLPDMPLNAIQALLAKNIEGLNAEAAQRVQEHVAALGKGGEQWVADGVGRLHAGDDCPFCRQGLKGSDIIADYQAYFSAAYASLRAEIAEQIKQFERTHAGDAPAAFERAVREYVQGADFWRHFAAVPESAIDTAAIARAWKGARDAVLAALRAKQAAPLDVTQLSDAALMAVAAYAAAQQELRGAVATTKDTNEAIARVKEAAAGATLAALEADLQRLKATKARHTQSIAASCQAYLDEKAAKLATEKARDAARAALDNYRTNVFPAYEAAINAYLKAFNADFRLGSVASVNTRGGSAANYAVLIDQAPVPLADDGGGPSFRTAMSAGDRNTLALAFFFASLDADPVALASKVIVIDDPMTSLDEHRTLATRHQVQALLGRAAQLIVLSHSKAFLCALWENTNKAACTPLKLVRAATGSAFEKWDVRADCVTEHDKRHELIAAYIAAAPNTDERAVAQGLRPILEMFVRVAYPAQLAPGAPLGKAFLAACETAIAAGAPLMSQADLGELRLLLDFAHRYHHETNPAWQTETINDQELLDFARRTVAFTRRRL